MQFNIKLLQTEKQISDAVLNALLSPVDNYLKKSLQIIRQKLPLLIQSILTNTPEYASLTGGQLQYEFGIPDPINKLSTILDIWSNNLNIEYNKPTIITNKIKAGFSVSLIKSNFADVLSSGASLVIDNLKGYQLPWLEWLLLEGNKIIVPKQEVIIGPSKYSRSGFALMRESNKSWRVPSQYAGTISNNWITRAIDDNESAINDLLNKAFKQ